MNSYVYEEMLTDDCPTVQIVSFYDRFDVVIHELFQGSYDEAMYHFGKFSRLVEFVDHYVWNNSDSIDDLGEEKAFIEACQIGWKAYMKDLERELYNEYATEEDYM